MSNVVGVTVRIKDGGPHLRGVVVDLNHGTVPRKFQHLSTTGEDAEVQLHALCQALEAEMTAQPVHAAVLLEAGWAPKAGLTKPNKHRLRSEGVALQVMREFTSTVRLGDKRQLGLLLRLTGPELQQQGETAAGKAWADAAAAAFVARSLKPIGPSHE